MDLSSRQLDEGVRRLLRAFEPDLRWHYKLGRLSVRGIGVPGEHEYRKGIADIARRVAKTLSASNRFSKVRQLENLLYSARSFAVLYKPKELKALEGLTWSHIEQLLTVEDKAERRQLERIVRRERLSYRELRDRILARRPKRSAARGKHKSRKFQTASEVRLSVQRSTVSWLAAQGDWTAPGSPLNGRGRSNAELRRRLAAAEKALQAVRRLAALPESGTSGI